ncbi:hypothetical protein A9X00_00785 [Mycobacterium sp. 1245805.9]|nr:hypothetical protein A9X00_00785 [Mycobacterium sp. 1245805.9]
MFATALGPVAASGPFRDGLACHAVSATAQAGPSAAQREISMMNNVESIDRRMGGLADCKEQFSMVNLVGRPQWYSIGTFAT